MTTSPAHERRQAEEALFAQLTDPDTSDAQRANIRHELVETHIGLVRHIAQRYAERGEPLDDVVQAGSVGLVQAVDRFDPSRGAAFSTYAVPVITGAIRRHFRDATWTMKVPRHVQEVRGRINSAYDSLTQELQRSPTVAEIAQRADVDAQDVLDSMEVSHARNLVSLTDDGAREVPLADRIGDLDAGLADVEDKQTTSALLATLPEREREIVRMRFFQGLSQSQIADQVGVSQVHVSRLLTRSLQRLRGELVQ